MLRSVNGVVLWDAEGRPGPVAPKVHVVPGGESAEPLRGIPFVLGAIQRIARNVPDFVGAEKPTVLTLRTRDGDAFRFAATVCYDNAFDDVYAGPLRDEPVDFYVVASNEAWYGASPEMDHMLAFSRVHAASVQRAIVRATNSGISCVVEPDGTVERLLEEDGRRKMISGALGPRCRSPTPGAARRGRPSSPARSRFSPGPSGSGAAAPPRRARGGAPARPRRAGIGAGVLPIGGSGVDASSGHLRRGLAGLQGPEKLA